MKKKKLLFIAFSLFLAFILTFTLGELILRMIPIPGTTVIYATFDTLVGYGFHPHSTVIYCNEKGDLVKRKVNLWGCLDREHEKEKRKGVYRIGFFGDSYTEARQVLLKETFFRIIERKLRNYNVECMAFGLSGFGTLHSYLNSKRWSDYFDLDLIIYVFCENDLGDHIKEIKRSTTLPYAVLKEDDFQIDYSFRKRNRFRKKIYYKFYSYLKAHSLVIATLDQRIKLLIKHGIKIKVNEKNRMMSTKSGANRIPNQNDLPFSWPAPWREYAKKLGSAIILKWSNDISIQSRKFVILYIPRDSEMEKDTKNQDSWKFWLESFCKKHQIIFIDPTINLLKMKLLDKDVFYGHFTKEGHKAFAEAFMNWFIENHQNL